MTKKTCFMIYPFSEPYKKRVKDIYKPAIECAGLTPVSADDDAVEIITEDIEEGIRSAHICFADITKDNPNVWYEVGYAYAHRKRIVMVCDKTVRSMEKLPFDIRVKRVIPYTDEDVKMIGSDGDFAQKITAVATAKAKKADSDSVAFPVTARQSRNSDNSLNPLDIQVLGIICTHDLETDNTIHRDLIISVFPDFERKKILLSLVRIEEMEYITKIVNYERDIYLGDKTDTVYEPTEKGRKWYRDNNSD